MIHYEGKTTSGHLVISDTDVIFFMISVYYRPCSLHVRDPGNTHYGILLDIKLKHKSKLIVKLKSVNFFLLKIF